VDPLRRLAAFLAFACAAAPAGALAESAPSLPGLAQYTPSTSQGSSPSEPARRRWELMGIAGYQLNTDIGTSAGHLSVSDEPVYGAAVGVEMTHETWLEFMWLYSEPTVRASGTPLLNSSQPLHVQTHYFQVGGTRGVQRGRVNVFGAGTLGAVLFMPGTLRYSNGTSTSLGDTWRFAFTLGGGAKIDLSRHLALRLDFRVAAPVYFSGGGVYAGSGGAGLTVSGGIPLWQFNFLGALVVTL
jgi:opacity protein-like surface antigen